MQCACAILLSVACPALQYFSTLSHKMQDFQKQKNLLNSNLCLIFSIMSSEAFLILRKTERDIIKNVYWSSCKAQVIIVKFSINPLNPELNPICYLLALLGAHHFLHISRIRVKLLTFRLLMSYMYIYIYIYMEHPFLMFLDHTQRRSTVGRTPLDE